MALFITALTWWRWPTGVPGAIALRLVITVTGVAVLWAAGTAVGVAIAVALVHPVTAGWVLDRISQLTLALP